MLNNCFLTASGVIGNTLGAIVMIVVALWVVITLLRLFGPIIGLLFYSGGSKTKYTKEEKEHFFSEVNRISPKTIEAVEKLSTFFSPNRRVTQRDVDSFLAEYAETKTSVDLLYRCNYKSDDVLRSKGIPNKNNPKLKGDHIVKLVLEVPTGLSREQKQLLKQFNDTLTERNYAKRSQFFQRIKRPFR